MAAQVEKARHLLFTEIDVWRQEHPHVSSGYHALTNSWHKSFMTLFGQPHNQTVNVLTHLIGAVVMAAMLGVLGHSLAFQHLLDGMQARHFHVPYHFPSWPFLVFYASATICLGLSATFHIGMCHSKRVYQTYNSLDYVGIVVLITGSSCPLVFFGFYCQPAIWLRYNAAITLFAATTIYLVSSPTYRDTDYRGLRTTIFLCLGFSGLVPIVHHTVTYGFPHTRQAFALGWLLNGVAFYLLGAMVYIFDFPERWFAKGRFDIYGNSHQIMHVCVLAAVWAHNHALHKAAAFRTSGTC